MVNLEITNVVTEFFVRKLIISSYTVKWTDSLDSYVLWNYWASCKDAVNQLKLTNNFIIYSCMGK